MIKNEKIVTANDADKPLCLSLEPGGDDQPPRAKEVIEIIAKDCRVDFFYSISFKDGFVAVFAKGGMSEEIESL